MTNHFNLAHGSWKGSQPGVFLWYCLLELQEWTEDHHCLQVFFGIFFPFCIACLLPQILDRCNEAHGAKSMAMWLRPNKNVFSTRLYTAVCICRHSGIAQLLWWFLRRIILKLKLQWHHTDITASASLGHRTLASLGIASPNRLSPWEKGKATVG